MNESNYELAEYYNFSGRSKPDGYSLHEAMRNAVSNRRTPEELVSAIEDGYSAAVEFQTSHRNDFVACYSISNAFEAVYEKGIAEKHRKTISDRIYGEYLVESQKMIGEYVAAHRRLANPNAAFYEQTVQSFAGEGYVLLQAMYWSKNNG